MTPGNSKTDLTQFNSSPTLEKPATWLGGPSLIHQNVTLLDCVNATILEEVLIATDLRQAIVRRISPQTVLIDSQASEALIKALIKRGYEPKIIKAAKS